MRYTGRVPGRPRPAMPAAEPDSSSADAWIEYLKRAGAGRVEQVDVPEDASDAEVLRAWRCAAMRASEVPVRATRRGTLA